MKQNKTISKAVFAIFIILVLAMSLAKKISAEEEWHEDNEDYKQQIEQEREYEKQQSEEYGDREYESVEYPDTDDYYEKEEGYAEAEEEGKEQEGSENDWDFRDGFDDSAEEGTGSAEDNDDGNNDDENQGSTAGNQSSSFPSSLMNYTKDQVRMHNSNSDCWVILFSKVYDITPLVTTHSGGNVFLCGEDNTNIYQSQHGTGMSRMNSYFAGNLASQQPSAAKVAKTQEAVQVAALIEGTTQSKNTTRTEGIIVAQSENVQQDILVRESGNKDIAGPQPEKKVINAQDINKKEKAPMKESAFISFLKWLGVM